MYHVYLIRSTSSPDQKYVGFTEDLQQRVKAHMQASPDIRRNMFLGSWSAILLSNPRKRPWLSKDI
ncbi:GIY-YIG nuclease family protein [Aquisalinus flavus]|uniref:GIY-YIG nuclease family protein n=1 Tax=Aquisalinus flavus TaxID=1526572 RepID=UPI003571620A